MKFEPTITTGTIVSIVLALCGGIGIWTSFNAQQAVQQQRLATVEAQLTVDAQRTKESIAEVKVDMREIKQKLDNLTEGMALLRGRASETATKK